MANRVERGKTEAEPERQPLQKAIRFAREEPGSALRKGTQFSAGLNDSGNAPLDRQGRRMVAVVVTYSWRPEGQVFGVYEGRNYIGQDPACEVRLIADQTLSGKHAAIFFRARAFSITDEKSMNGTFVNGVEAPLTGMPLGNYDEIKTGATVWKFIVIEPTPTNNTE